MKSLEVAIILFCFVFTLIQKTDAQACSPIDQCSCRIPDGPVISLWDIDKRYEIGSVEPGFSYLYRPCTGLKEPNSVCDGSLGCQVTESDKSKVLIAKKPKLIDAGKDSGTGLYYFTYTGSKDQETQQTITLKIILQCSENEVASFTKMFGCLADSCIITLTSKCACPGHCKVPKKSSAATTSHKLSIGSTLCIVLLALLVAYLVFGLLLNKYAFHKEGSEIIPQKDLWSGFPSLVKDGCVFTFHKLRRKKGEYQEL
ncbi:uncharacterized protein LOC135682310 [Rhopilema esculentum]|uniref:uncharacterized protein LOC135682310 n=1 Tax=Rhopilema esculentum TaxID=499914 RepID=UPI0031E373A4